MASVGDFMNKNLNQLLLIDQEIGDFLYQNVNASDEELQESFEKKNYIGKALRIINKLSSKNVIELLKRSTYLNNFIDIKKFIKKYPLNKKYLKDNQEMYLDEYHKLKNICYYFSDIANDYTEFQEYMNVIDADKVEYYLLKHMSNQQIYLLSQETSDWEQKLYYFSYLKKNKS